MPSGSSCRGKGFHKTSIKHPNTARHNVITSLLARYPHLKEQGRCMVHKREPPEGEEDTFEFTEEEQVTVAMTRRLRSEVLGFRQPNPSTRGATCAAAVTCSRGCCLKQIV